ncbi:MAG TPA: hypothetical protein VH306_09720 [Gaiellaceae bacterium]
MSAAILRGLEDALAGDETGEELPTALVVLASLAGVDVDMDEDEIRGATRRAVLLLAAGGDPERGLDLNGPAVDGLANDLRTSDRQLSLERGVEELYGQVSRADLPYVTEAVKALRATPDVAWRAYACSLLAEELAGDDY